MPSTVDLPTSLAVEGLMIGRACGSPQLHRKGSSVMATEKVALVTAGGSGMGAAGFVVYAGQRELGAAALSFRMAGDGRTRASTTPARTEDAK